MFTIQKLRPMISVAAAILFVIVGSLGVFPEFRYSVIDALSEIDWNVLMMISGTMGTVYLFIDSRMPMQLSDFIIALSVNLNGEVTIGYLFDIIGK